MHQIWIKPNNRYDDPRQWIQKGCISFSYINAQHSYYWLEEQTGRYHFVTKLHSGDYIYVFEVNKDSKKSLLKFKFEIASDYDFNYHGYKIKNIFECLDEINQFDENQTNNMSMWAAHKNFNTNGKIIKKCINCNNWKLIETFETNKDVSNQK